MFNNVFFTFYLLGDNVKKYPRARQATDDNIALVQCMLDTSGYKNTLYKILLFHNKCCYAKANQCCVMCTLHVS